MDFINSKISAKLVKSDTTLYQEESPYDDYEMDCRKLWTSHSQFKILENSFHLFSTEELFSGILFCKSKKPQLSQWFKAKFYRLYKDRLVLYSVNHNFSKKNLIFNISEKRSTKAKKSNFAQGSAFTGFG